MTRSKLIKKKTPQKQKPQTPQEKFRHYWATIEKYQNQLSRLIRDQEALFTHFQKEVLPLEHQYIQSVYDKTERLLSFAGKKSLGKKQRDALFDWIDEELSKLRSYPFNNHLDINKLSDQFLSLTAQQNEPPSKEEMAQIRELLETRFSFITEFSDDELSDMMKNPEKMRATMEQHFQQQEEDSFNADKDSDDDDIEDDDDNIKNAGVPPVNSLLSAQYVTQLYRKVAKTLHPDREQNPDEKEKKHHLMATLSKAKKEHDIWTILTLYHQYVDASFSFDAQTIPAINTLLENRVDTLKNELKQQKYEQSLPGMVWQELGGASEKIREKKIREHQQYLLESTADENAQTQSLRSLVVLKEYLAQRYYDELDLFEEFINSSYRR